MTEKRWRSTSLWNSIIFKAVCKLYYLIICLQNGCTIQHDLHLILNGTAIFCFCLFFSLHILNVNECLYGVHDRNDIFMRKNFGCTIQIDGAKLIVQQIPHRHILGIAFINIWFQLIQQEAKLNAHIFINWKYFNITWTENFHYNLHTLIRSMLKLCLSSKGLFILHTFHIFSLMHCYSLFTIRWHMTCFFQWY